MYTTTALVQNAHARRRVLRVGVSTLRLWDGRDGHPIATLDHPGVVLSASFCPDSERLLPTGADPTARLWDLTAADPAPDAIILARYIF